MQISRGWLANSLIMFWHDFFNFLVKEIHKKKSDYERFLQLLNKNDQQGGVNSLYCKYRNIEKSRRKGCLKEIRI